MKNRRMATALAVILLSGASIMAKDIRTALFKVEQLHCESCQRKVQGNIKFEKGVKELSTDLKEKTVTIVYDAEKTNVEKLKEGFKKIKFDAELVKEAAQKEKE